MFAMDVNELAQTEWVICTLVARMKDGTLRFCVNYRKLNEVIIWDTYLVPLMDECIESLVDATIFLDVGR